MNSVRIDDRSLILRLDLMMVVLAICLMALVGCGGAQDATVVEADEEESSQSDPMADSAALLDQVIDGAWRSEEERARDIYRNPKETLLFFGIEPHMAVGEVWPGGGWYANILAPYLALAEPGGSYTAIHFDPNTEREYILNALARFEEKFLGTPELYGDMQMTALSADTDAVAPPGSLDAIVTFRNVHNWMAGGFADKAFADFYAALKPGGVLGVVEHRAVESDPQDPKAENGYVREDYVVALAKTAGFVFEKKSEINANPKDTKNHPFGVWTLPPASRKAARGEEPAADFDADRFLAIGESDRATLLFRKPDSDASAE